MTVDAHTRPPGHLKDPAFVIHGVAHRDRDDFAREVAALQDAAGVELVPVFWGDLGAQEEHIRATLPSTAALRRYPADEGLRDGTPVPQDADAPPLARSALLDHGPTALEPAARLTAVEAAVREQYASPPADSGLRAGGPSYSAPDVEDVLELLREEWPRTEWLCHTDDPALLAEVGHALANAVSDTADIAERAGEPLDDSYDGLRATAPEDGRLRALVRRRLRDLDRVAGAAIEAVAGRLNHLLRSRLGPATTRFLGDVLVYQRHQAKIHARVREAIDAVDPALGRGPDRPVRVVAHSLGGVIAVDMATASAPLWTSSLLTFGSQAAFFHVCDPRGGQLAPYAGGQGVALPPSLSRWTNLWEPLDMLAFAASTVFRLHDGSTPVDVSLPHSASDGLWTHSAYWSLPSLAEAVATTMGHDHADDGALG
ncbi:hypothetical protein [Streptomyces sp. NPDC021969]|uniref:hypothetical protein n=1 Tax=unclassified Streptomyces TaxID=2593676 RepID=UPI0034098151